jgi:hypothetical protein
LALGPWTLSQLAPEISQMPDSRPAFIVPEGLTLVSEDDGLFIDFDGDVVLRSPLGQQVTRVRSRNGNVVLGPKIDVSEVSAPRGKVIGDGSLTLKAILAQAIEIDGDLDVGGVFAQDVRVSGDLIAERVTAETGDIRIGGRASIGDELVANAGNITINGGVRAAGLRAPLGRITIRGTAQVESIQSGSDVVLHGEAEGRLIESDGGIELHGSSKVQWIAGDNVRITGPMNELATVSARSVISLGPGRIESDLFYAPVVDLADASSGRITAIECHNPLSNSQINGRLRLRDLAPYIGDPAAYLARLGLSSLGSSRAESPAPPPAPAPAPAPSDFDPFEATDPPIADQLAALDADVPLDFFPGPEPEPEPDGVSELAAPFSLDTEADREGALEPTVPFDLEAVRDLDAALALDSTPAPEAFRESRELGEPKAAAPPSIPFDLDAALAADPLVDELLDAASSAPDEPLFSAPPQRSHSFDLDAAFAAEPSTDDAPITSLDPDLQPDWGPGAASRAASEAFSDDTLAAEHNEADGFHLDDDTADETEIHDIPPADDTPNAIDPLPLSADPTESSSLTSDAVAELEAAIGRDLTADLSLGSETPTLSPGAGDILTTAPPQRGSNDDGELPSVSEADFPLDGEASSASDSALEMDSTLSLEFEAATGVSTEAVPVPQPGGTPESLVDLADAPSEETLFQFTDTDVAAADDDNEPLAMAGDDSDQADDVLDLSTPGSTVVLPREKTQVEEIPVRPPSGPHPEGSGQLMVLDEEDSTAAEPVAEATQAAPEPEPQRVVTPPRTPAPRRPPANNDPVYALMVETMDRIRNVYGSDTPPDPVHRIQSLVDSQDYDRIRAEFSGMMDELVEYHRAADTQLQPRVAHNFRIIDTLVRNL